MLASVSDLSFIQKCSPSLLESCYFFELLQAVSKLKHPNAFFAVKTISIVFLKLPRFYRDAAVV
jgi:hypothetical protein